MLLNIHRHITTKVIAVFIACLFLFNDVAHGLSPRVGAPDAYEEMCATGEKLFGIGRETPDIDFDLSKRPNVFFGKAPSVPGISFPVQSSISARIEETTSKNPILNETSLIKALELFRDTETNVPANKLEIREGYYKPKKDGSLTIARLEKHGDKYVLIVHPQFIKMWEYIRQNDVWFYANIGNKTRLTSVAWGIFYRLAKHEMADIQKAGIEGKGHATYLPLFDLLDVRNNELLANETIGNYSLVNDAIWLWFLGSFAFDNTTRYRNNHLKDRLNWFFTGEEAIRLKLDEEFPNLLTGDTARKYAIKLACALNYHFFRDTSKQVIDLTIDQDSIDKWHEREGLITDEPISAGGLDGKPGNTPKIIYSLPDDTIKKLAKSIAIRLAKVFGGIEFETLQFYAFSAIATALLNFDPTREMSLESWVWKKGKYLAIDEMRQDGLVRRKGQREIPKTRGFWTKTDDRGKETSEQESVSDDHGDDAEQRMEILDQIEQVFDLLSPDAKRIIELYYIEEMTMKQVAETLNLSERWIRQLHTVILKGIKAGERVSVYLWSKEIMPGFGKRITRARVGKELSQKELGEKLQKKQGLISEWENEKSIPTYQEAHELAKILKVSRYYILKGDIVPGWMLDKEELYKLTPGWGARLQKARKANNFSPSMVGENLGLSREPVFYWEREEREPPHSALRALCKIYKVRVEYITKGDREPDWSKFENMEFALEKGWGDRIKRLINVKGMSVQKLAEALEIDTSVLYNWLEQLSFPSRTQLGKLVKILYTSISFIIDGGNEPTWLKVREITPGFEMRLRKVMASMGMKAAELAEKIGVNKSKVDAWRYKQTKPTTQNLEKLAKALRVQLIYLTQGKEEPDWEAIKEKITGLKPGWGGRIKKTREFWKMSWTALSIKIDRIVKIVQKWENEKSIPDKEHIRKLAQIFKIATDYIIKGTKEPDWQALEEKIDFLKPGWGERIKRVREARGLSQAALHKRMGTMTHPTYDLEYEKIYPNMEYLSKLAKVLKISMGFLIAGTNEPDWLRKREDLYKLEPGWGKRLQRVREARGWSGRHMQGLLKGGLKISSWEREERIPTMHQLGKLAAILSVPLQYITKGIDEPEWVKTMASLYTLKKGWGKRIRKAREMCDMSRDDLAKLVGVWGVTLGHWENEDSRPPHKKLIKLAEHMKINLIYITRGEDEPDWNTFAKAVWAFKPEWGKRLKKARKAMGLTLLAVGEKLGRSGTCIYSWEKENNYPSKKYLQKLSEALNISIDYILKGGDEPKWFAEKEEASRIKNGWGKRIRKARNSMGLSRKALGKIIGPWDTTIHAWELKNRKPSNQMFKKLAKALDVDLAYLVKGENEPDWKVLKEERTLLKSGWTKRIGKAVTVLGLLKGDFCQRAGICTATWAGWRSGKTRYVSMEQVQKVAKALGVSFKYVADGTDEPDWETFKKELPFRPGWGARIYKAMVDRSLSKEELATLLTEKTQVISAWLDEKKQPTEKELSKLSNILEVHIYYILKGIYVPPRIKALAWRSPGWGDRISKARNARSMTQTEVAKRMRKYFPLVKFTTISLWEHEDLGISQSQMQEFARILKIDFKYLSQGLNEPNWKILEEESAEIKTGRGKRLRKARLSRGLTQEELANMIGTNHSQIYIYEYGGKPQTMEILRKLAVALKVSFSYLATGKNEPNWVKIEKESGKTRSGWGKRIKEAREALRLTQDYVTEKLHLWRVTISHWENGKGFPTKKNLDKLAKILKVSTKYIKIGENKPQWIAKAKKKHEFKKGWGERIRKLREALGLTWIETGRRIGFHGSYAGKHIKAWEREESVPSLEEVKKIVKIFGCHSDYIIKGLKEPDWKKLRAKAFVLTPGWGNRIARARNAKGLTQRQLAKKIGHHHRQVVMWESEKSGTDLETIKKLAKVLSVSIGFIMRGENTPAWLKAKEDLPAFRKGWGKRLRRLRGALDITMNDLGRQLGYAGTVPGYMIKKWEEEESRPTPRRLQQLVEVLECSIEYITEGMNEPDWEALKQKGKKSALESGWGERIRLARKAKGLSQVELAEIINVHPKTIGEWENDITDISSLQYIEKLAEALDVGVEYILKDTQEIHPLITIISEYIVDLAREHGPGHVVPITDEQRTKAWEAVNLLHKSKTEIILSTQFGLTDKMQKAIRDIGEKGEVRNVEYSTYSTANDLEKILDQEKPDGVKRILLTDKYVRGSVSSLAISKPGLFKDIRLLHMELPDDYYNMKGNEKTVHQARIIMIAILARLLEKQNSPIEKTLLAEMLKEHLGSSVDLDIFINKLIESENDKTEAQIKTRLEYFLSLENAVRFTEKLEKEIELMKTFWKYA